MKKFLFNTVKALMLPILIYCIFLCICPDRFSNWDCVYTIFIQSIIPTITAYAVAYGSICGLFDFTVGSALIISGVVGGLCAAKFGMVGMLVGGFAAGMLTCMLTGALNHVLKIPSLVLTMGLTMIYEIVGKQLAGQFGFVQIETKYAVLGSSPYIILVFLFTALLFYFITNHTKFSFHMRAVGSDELVAKNAGIKTGLVKFQAFAFGGIFLSIAAILTLSQSGSVGAQTGLGSVTIMFKPLISVLLALVLQRICNLTFGIFISQFSLNIIFIGLIAAGMPDTFQNVVLGLFLLIVMIFFQNADWLREKRSRLKSRKLAGVRE